MNEVALIHAMMEAFGGKNKVSFSKSGDEVLMEYNDDRYVGRTVQDCLFKYAQTLALIQLNNTNK